MTTTEINWTRIASTIPTPEEMDEMAETAKSNHQLEQIRQWELENVTNRFKEHAKGMANLLRDLADEVERDAKSIVEDTADRKYANEMERTGWIVNQISFKFANLNVHDFMIRGADLRRVRDEREAS